MIHTAPFLSEPVLAPSFPPSFNPTSSNPTLAPPLRLLYRPSLQSWHPVSSPHPPPSSLPLLILFLLLRPNSLLQLLLQPTASSSPFSSYSYDHPLPHHPTYLTSSPLPPPPSSFRLPRPSSTWRSLPISVWPGIPPCQHSSVVVSAVPTPRPRPRSFALLLGFTEDKADLEC